MHALQSYFFDKDSNEWIRTVLAPMGRQLAARWQGAHRIPQESASSARPLVRRDGAEPKKGPSPILLVIAVVIVAMVGGAGIVGAQNGLLRSVPTTFDEIASLVPQAVASAVVAPLVPVASPTAVVAATSTVSTAQAPAATRAPAPAPATAAPGPIGTLPDGSVVLYTGPTSATRGNVLAARFTVTTANGTPATGGSLSIVLGDPAKDPRVVTGAPIDANGRVRIDIPITLPVGAYPLSIGYGPYRAQVATVAIR